MQVLRITCPENAWQGVKSTPGTDWSETIGLATHRPRNKWLSQIVCQLHRFQCKKILVFTLWECHVHALVSVLSYALGSKTKVVGITGKLASENEGLIDEAKSAGTGVVVATLQFLSTGYNDPSIDSIVYALSPTGAIKNIQSLGRGQREKEGKICTQIIDIVDQVGGYKMRGSAAIRAKEYMEREDLVVDCTLAQWNFVQPVLPVYFAEDQSTTLVQAFHQHTIK